MQINKISNQASFKSGNYGFIKMAQNAGKNAKTVAKTNLQQDKLFKHVMNNQSASGVPSAIKALIAKLSSTDPFAGIL